jgi:hypothetical protein
MHLAGGFARFRFSNPQYYHDIETARQGYLRSYPVGKSDRASGVR